MGEVGEQEREDLVVWLRQVCEEEAVQVEVFCLAINCVDRFLALVPLKLSQLQLLGSACLMVAWKVREDRQIRVETILKYSNYNIKADELLEWEMLVLARLHWNISPKTSPWQDLFSPSASRITSWQSCRLLSRPPSP